MTLITLILTLALVGFVLWLVTTYIPMPPPFRQVIIVVVVIVLILWLVNGLGLLAPMNRPLFR